MAEVEIFTPTGVLAGVTARPPLSNDGPDLTAPLMVTNARWYPVDGSEPSFRGDDLVAPDDILVVCSDEVELNVHMALHPVRLQVGPYVVDGRLATHPGFDPARALARPAGGFVGLRDVTIELAGRPEAGTAERAHVHVNRYAVDSVASALMLGFFFPGARLVDQEPVPA